ncbi:hypothetical protein D3C72_2009460 [compost metagenome]
MLLRGFQLVFSIQRGGQVVAVVLVVRLKLNGFGQAEEGELALPVVKQPKPQRMLQIGRVRLGLELLGQ